MRLRNRTRHFRSTDRVSHACAARRLAQTPEEFGLRSGAGIDIAPTADGGGELDHGLAQSRPVVRLGPWVCLMKMGRLVILG
jgi:hypothetical protein